MKICLVRQNGMSKKQNVQKNNGMNHYIRFSCLIDLEKQTESFKNVNFYQKNRQSKTDKYIVQKNINNKLLTK